MAGSGDAGNDDLFKFEVSKSFLEVLTTSHPISESDWAIACPIPFELPKTKALLI